MTIHTPRRLATLGFAAAIALAAAPAAFAADVALKAAMDGAHEVPGPGDADGSGVATLQVSDLKVCYELTAHHIDAATAAHIHKGAAGAAGPVVVPLTPPTAEPSKGCADIDHALAADLKAHPEAYYVNVHTAPFPAGAVRGQLHK